MRAIVGGSSMTGRAPGIAGLSIVDLSGPAARLVASTGSDARDPSYLAAVTRAGATVLYVAEHGYGGRLSSWQVTRDGLDPIAAIRADGGLPSHIEVHPDGDFVLCANYRAGSVSVHPTDAHGHLLEATDVVVHEGSGPNRDRQEAAHPHMVVTDPVRGDVVVADLGTDQVYRYQLDRERATLHEVDRTTLPPGTGPRHLVIVDDLAYVVGELTSTLTVLDLSTSPMRVISTTETQQLCGDEPSYPSAIRMGSSGDYCYVANRGPNTISAFRVEGRMAQLVESVPAGGDYPWDMCLIDDRLHVVNQRSGSLTSFDIDAAGVPRRTGTLDGLECPVALLAVPDA